MAAGDRRGMAIFLAILIALAYGALVALIWKDVMIPEREEPWVQITSPFEGGLVREGQELAVHSTAIGEGIVRIELWVDGTPLVATANPRPQEGSFSVIQQWKASRCGRHSFSVKAYNATGQVGTSPPIAVTVVPEGKIVFATNRDGPYRLYTMFTDGSEQAEFAFVKVEGREPTCSSNGLLAFVSGSQDGYRDIWLVEADGGELRNLTDDPANDHDPAWS
ncbi:MAG: hypothetical protein U9R11_05955, partial [Chloroflexota bacterium]|nr:hypothetical protein [Chloroflexota bacterium]